MSNGTVHVRDFGFLRSLTQEEINLFLDLARPVTFGIGEEIIKQGDVHSSLHLVTDGILHVLRQADRVQVLLGRLEKGSFFGEIGLFDPGPATATVRGIRQGALYRIERESFQQFLKQHPDVGCKILNAIMNEVAKRMRRVDQKLMDSVFWGEVLQK